MIKNIVLAFIPIFVAVDAIGVLPIFISLTEGLNKKAKFKIVFESVMTAMCLALGFIFLGKAIFRFLNITIGDFMVAGGSILFCIAIIDIVNPSKRKRLKPNDLGSVPIGTPLIVGPAVLTTSLIVLDQYGIGPTLLAILSNVVLAGTIFMSSHILIRFVGVSGSRALSKITSLLLAAIAVMMIRRGVMYLLVPK